jgi:2-phospho-L-lactate guanylyltransferase
MLADVLAACAGADLAGTLVVTDTGEAWRTAWRAGARPLLDPGLGLNAAVRAGLAAAKRAGARSALVLPGDVPLVQAADLTSLIAAAGNDPLAAVVVPDHAGSGTNALLLSPPGVLAPAFGPGSRARHEELARAAGAECRIAEPPSLLLDVDTLDDLAALRNALDARTGGAAHTRGLLARLDRR